MADAAPHIHVKIDEMIVPNAVESIQLQGTLEDDDGLKTLYAFVNGKKRYFWTVPQAALLQGDEGVTVPFSATLPLEEGANMVELYVHDNEDARSVHLFQVWRETTSLAQHSGAQ